MRVLITESQPHLADDVEHALVEAGHEPLRCRDVDGSPMGCAVSTASCPLEGKGVDVTVVVRADEADLTPHEDGGRCAVRRHVPVAVVGRPGPFGDHASARAGVAGDVVDAVTRAADAPSPAVRQAVVDAVRVATGIDVTDDPSAVHVRRRAGNLTVAVTLDAPLDREQRDHIAVRIAGRVRTVDTTSATVDVAVTGA